MEKILVFYEFPKDLIKLEVSVESICEVFGETDQSEFIRQATQDEFSLLVVCCSESEINGPILIKKISENEDIKIPMIVYESKISKSLKLKFLQYGVLDIISSNEDVENNLLRFQINLRKKKLFQENDTPSIYKKGPFKIDFQRNHVQVKEEGEQDYKDLGLTQIEYKLLCYFIRNEKKVFSRDQIVNYLGDGEVIVSERSVDVHISALRKKSPVIKNAIRTIYGLGYKFEQAS
ncbi:MAG: response regulator transcription factor [Bacteriovoracaceae bacterium]